MCGEQGGVIITVIVRELEVGVGESRRLWGWSAQASREDPASSPASSTQLMRSRADGRMGPNGLPFKAEPTGPPLPFTSAHRSDSRGIQMRPPSITGKLFSDGINAKMDSLIRPLENIITWSEKWKLSGGAERHRWQCWSLGFGFALFRVCSIARINPVCVWDNLTLVAKKKQQWYLYWKWLWEASCLSLEREVVPTLPDHPWSCQSSHPLLLPLRTLTFWNYLDHLPVYDFTVSSPWFILLTSCKKCQ